MSFKDIIGQEKPIKMILKSIKEDKVSSSYIFVGNEGVGKKFTAIEFAKVINCLNLSKNLEACDNCETCNKINHGCCPDLKIIEPIKNSIKIEQIRELSREIELKPFKNRKKIYIIDKAETMTLDAENCLLKTLEEPPNYAIIILICLNINSILPTVISRCQVIKFGLASTLEIKKIVLKKENLDESIAELISKLSQGSIGKAYKLLSDKEYFNRRAELLNLLSKISPGKYDNNIFINLEKTLKKTNKIEEILEIVSLWYRDILIIKELEITKYIINIDKLETLRKMSKLYPLKVLMDILDYLEQMQEFIKKNVNKGLILERLYLKMVGVEYCLK